MTAGGIDGMREILDKVMSRMEALELHLQGPKATKTQGYQPPRCYRCNKEGHFRRNCPLQKNMDDPEASQRAQQVCYCISASVRVHGTLGGQNVSYLIDSGAAVSVVSYSILSPRARAGVREDAPLTVGANGVPLDVLGTVNLLAVVGKVSVKHSFVVARTLTVECLLGIDFLSRYGAIIDCAENKLTFSRRPQGTTHGDERWGVVIA